MSGKENPQEFPKNKHLHIFNQFTYEIRDFPGVGRSFIAVKEFAYAGHNPFKQAEESKMNDTLPPYIEFANLDYNDEKALLKYANKKGVPHNPSEFYEKKAGINFGAFRENDTHTWSYDYWVEAFGGMSFKSICKFGGRAASCLIYPVNLFMEEVKKMRRVLKLKGLSEDPKNYGIGFPVDDINGSRAVYYDKRRAAVEVCSVVSRELEGAKLSLWEGYDASDEEGNPVYVEMCLVKNYKQALYAILLKDIAIKTRQCADIKCSQYFSVTRDDRIYCSPYCARKVARRATYWNNKKKKENLNHGKAKRER